MNKDCLTDDLLLTQYFEGACSESSSRKITYHLANCSGCQSHFAQLASLLADIDETQVKNTHVPAQLTQRAMALFDTVRQKSTFIELAIGMLNGLLTPLSAEHTPLIAGTLRGAPAQAEDLTYHLTVGQLSLAIELNSGEAQQIDLCVRPLQPISSGWTIRLNQGDVTRRLSSFDTHGIQVDALGHGDYVVTLEHQHEEEHQFHLRLVSQND
jgi:hypothetical protein